MPSADPMNEADTLSLKFRGFKETDLTGQGRLATNGEAGLRQVKKYRAAMRDIARRPAKSKTVPRLPKDRALHPVILSLKYLRTSRRRLP
jgi:hypothetical protein